MNETIKLEWLEKPFNIKRKSESSDIEIRTEILLGDVSVWESIIRFEFANKENVDMIVIGNSGSELISKVKSRGSVSSKYRS